MEKYINLKIDYINVKKGMVDIVLCILAKNG